MEQTEHNTAAIPAPAQMPAALDPLGAHTNATDTEAGKVINFRDSDEAINRTIARFQDGLSDWNYRSVGLANLVRDVRDWARDLWPRFVSADWDGKLIKQPPILLRFQWESPRVLGHYQPGRNDLGFRWEISINPRHAVRGSEIDVAETVLHELLHCFEDLAGTAPRSPNNYHSIFFRNKADEFGIPCTPYGASLGIREGSPFAHWARERGLTGQPAARIEVEDIPPARAVKRTAWICACPRDIAVTVHVPRGSDLQARCERCRARFERKSARNAR